jgi:hypothetical protein
LRAWVLSAQWVQSSFFKLWIGSCSWLFPILVFFSLLMRCFLEPFNFLKFTIYKLPYIIARWSGFITDCLFLVFKFFLISSIFEIRRHNLDNLRGIWIIHYWLIELLSIITLRSQSLSRWNILAFHIRATTGNSHAFLFFLVSSIFQTKTSLTCGRGLRLF